jgi:hypothetical protein
MLIFNPDERATVLECINHPVFNEIRQVELEQPAQAKVTISVDDYKKNDKLSSVDLIKIFQDELRLLMQVIKK